MADRDWGKVAAGMGAAALVGAGAFYLYGKSTERPAFALVEADGAFELRDYPELLVAETVNDGVRLRALDRGFYKLARYIFARDRGGERIAMTAPVLSDRVEAGWRTRFVMPARYARGTLPEPGPGVRIAARPARRVAVIRFPGRADDTMLADREAELRGWMAARDLAAGAVENAFYDPPFILGPLRRNEVMVEVAA